MLRNRWLMMLLLLLFMLLLIPTAYAQTDMNSQTVNFHDVDSSHPNKVFVDYLAGQGVFGGFPDGSFRPGDYLTRAQAASLMVRALGLTAGGITETSFTDIADNHWALADIATAEKAGLLKGFPDGTFRPNQTLTRAQSVALIIRMSGQPIPELHLPQINDLAPGHWAAGAVAVALDAGMVNLNGSSFEPNEFFTRADIARALSIAITLSPVTRALPMNGELIPNKGTVKVQKKGTSDYYPVDEKIIIGPGDSIQTGADGRAELLFADGTGLLLDPGVNLTVKDTRGLAYIKKNGTPGNAVDWLNIDLQQGKVFVFLASVISVDQPGEIAYHNLPMMLASVNQGDWIEIAAQASNKDKEASWWKYPEQKRVKVQVDMPWGVAGFRGSAGSFAVYQDGSCETNNLTGDSFMSSGLAQVDLKPLQTASSRASGEVTRPKAMTREQLADFARKDVKAFFEAQAGKAVENQALQSTGEEKTLPPALLQQQNIDRALEQIDKTIGSSTPGGGGGGGGGKTDSKISGTVSLPIVKASDTNLYVYAWAETDIPNLHKYGAMKSISIPAGSSSIAYSITLAANAAGSGYRVGYFIDSSYIPYGYYSAGGTTPNWLAASLVDVSSREQTDIDLTLIDQGYYIGSAENTAPGSALTFIELKELEPHTENGVRTIHIIGYQNNKLIDVNESKVNLEYDPEHFDVEKTANGINIIANTVGTSDLHVIIDENNTLIIPVIVYADAANTIARMVAASVTLSDIPYTIHITLASDGLYGHLNLAGQPDELYILAGSLTVDRKSMLTLNKIIKHNGSMYTIPGELATQQELPRNHPVSIELFDYLGWLDSGDEGVSIGFLRELFGTSVRIEGFLIRPGGIDAEVELMINLIHGSST